MDVWLETDEQRDVLISLNEVLHQVNRVAEGDVYAWKWAVISLSCALNGALTCNLSGTMNIGALRDKDVTQTIAALKQGSDVEMPTEPQLARPKDLLKRARRADKRKERAGPLLTINGRQIQEFNRLMNLRNSFMHFEPMGWSIETSGMALMFEQALTILDQIIDDDWSFRHRNDGERQYLADVCKNIRSVLNRI